MFLFLLGIAALSILLVRTPAALPADAPDDQFSAARACAYVQAIATVPRPVGSPAHAKVRDYLVGELAQLGLDPQVQRAVAMGSQAEGWNGTVVDVENVVGRLRGSASGTRAVLLMAHYDSEPTGPGACDDASGVAVLLETARALKAADRPLANDVIFLFSDGEEAGLMGARAFVAAHPWVKDVGLVLSFDSANYGATAAETTPGDDWLIAEYAHIAPYPRASSVGSKDSQVLDPFTVGDLAVFADAGYAGLQFTADGSSAYYNTSLDNIAGMDLSFLQHEGSQALSLVRYFGNAHLTASHQGKIVYFNLLGTYLLVHYSQLWVFPLLVLAALVWASALALGIRWKQASLRGVLLGAVASLVVVAVLSGVSYLLWRLVLVVYPQYSAQNFGAGANPYNSLYYFVAFLALGVGLTALLHTGLRRRIRTAELAFGGTLLCLGVALALSIGIPGASYIPTWAVLFSSVGLCGWLILRRTRPKRPWAIVCVALFSMPAILLLVPLIQGLYVAETIHAVWLPLAFLGLLAGLLAPHLEIMAEPRRSWLPGLMGFVVVGALVAGHLTSDYSPTRPLRDGVWYGVSADEHKAYWLGTVLTDELDVYTGQFLEDTGRVGDVTDFFPGNSMPYYKTLAPLADITAPKVEELAETGPGAFHLHVTPDPGAAVTHIYLLPDPETVTVYVDGRRIESEGWIGYWNPPAEGFDLTVEWSVPDPLTVRVVDLTYGLPTLPGFSYTSRPAGLIADADDVNDSTVVAKTFTFRKE